MKCADPILCANIGNKKLYRHFSLASAIIKATHHLVFNCGKCIFCRKKKSLELATRCVLHASLYETNCFLTLTYDEKKETYHNNLDYSDIQKFKKRLRQHVSRNYYGKKIEIFNVHEYGKNGKKHWHLVVFNHDFKDKETTPHTGKNPLYKSKKLQELWPHGFSSIGTVTEASAMYQSQYMDKDTKNGNLNNEKKSHSKHAGIAKPYFMRHYSQLLRLGYIPFQSKKIPLPRYFQKLAHKHYSHFYAPENFFDTTSRKKLHRPFKIGQENLDIANHYKEYEKIKKEKIEELEKNWQETITKYLYNYEKTDFQISAENYLYDQQQKQKKEKF